MRAPEPTALPIVVLPGQLSSELIPESRTLFHDRLS
jgi:hypothetical protein